MRENGRGAESSMIQGAGSLFWSKAESDRGCDVQ